MAKCYKCGAETALYVNGKPMCLACADAQAKKQIDFPKQSRGIDMFSSADIVRLVTRALESKGLSVLLLEPHSDDTAHKA
jgi:hypothetical protein